MKHISLTLLFLFLLVNSNLYSSKVTEIIGVVELIRHGARTPKTFMEASAKLYFGSRKTQLTVNGYRQHILLGRFLRRQYLHGDKEKLLSKKFNPTEIRVISSPRQRTIFSASANVMGIFPNSIPKILYVDKNLKNNDLPPINNYKADKQDGKEFNIHVLSYKNDHIFHSLNCRRKGAIKTIKEQMKKENIFNLSKQEISDATLDILQKYNFMFASKSSFKTNAEFMEFQRNYYKRAFKQSFFKKLVEFIRPFKYHHNSYNKLKPESLKTIERFLINSRYETRIKDSKELKLASSAQIIEIIDFFEKRIANKNKEKLLIMSGHATNLVNFISNIIDPVLLRKLIDNSLKNIRDFKFLIPPLASSLILELHRSKKDGKYLINIVFNGESINIIKFRTNVKFYKDVNGLDYNDFLALLKSRVEKSYKFLMCGHSLNIR